MHLKLLHENLYALLVIKRLLLHSCATSKLLGKMFAVFLGNWITFGVTKRKKEIWELKTMRVMMEKHYEEVKKEKRWRHTERRTDRRGCDLKSTHCMGTTSTEFWVIA